MIKEKAVINSYLKCEYFKTNRIPIIDFFDRPEKWYCEKKEGVIIDGYYDILDKGLGISDSCLLENYKG